MTTELEELPRIERRETTALDKAGQHLARQTKSFVALIPHLMFVQKLKGALDMPCIWSVGHACEFDAALIFVRDETRDDMDRIAWFLTNAGYKLIAVNHHDDGCLRTVHDYGSIRIHLSA